VAADVVAADVVAADVVVEDVAVVEGTAVASEEGAEVGEEAVVGVAAEQLAEKYESSGKKALPHFPLNGHF
jgi:hypothetical protein